MDLENRLKKLENRISFIEKFLGDNYMPKPKRDTVTPVAPPNPVRVANASTSGESYQVPNYAVPDLKEKASLHFIDNNAFNKKMLSNTTNSLFMPIALLGFLLVTFFIVRFAVDTGWLTPLKQIFIAALLSIIFIGAGFLYRGLNDEYIRYLPVIGVLILFLAAFGSSNYYHFFPRNIAFLFIAMIAISCLLMYQEFKHGIYLIVAAAGGYIVPLYVANESNLTLTNSYFVLMSIVFAGMAWRLSLRPVYLLCAYLALPVSAIAEYSDNDISKKVLFIMAHFLIFSLTFFVDFLKQKFTLTRFEVFAIAPLIVFFFIIEYYNLDQLHAYLGPAFIFIASLYLAALYLKLKPKVAAEGATHDNDDAQIVHS